MSSGLTSPRATEVGEKPDDPRASERVNIISGDLDDVSVSCIPVGPEQPFWNPLRFHC